MLNIGENAQIMERLKKLKHAAQNAIGDCFEPELKMVCNDDLKAPWSLLICFRSPGGQIDLMPPRLQVWGACPLSAIEAAFAETRRRFTEAEAKRAAANAALFHEDQGAA